MLPVLYIGGGLLVVVVVLWLGRRGRAGRATMPEPGEPAHDGERVLPPGSSVGFGYKTGWVAVKGVPPARVIEALGLRKVVEVEWSEGIEHAYAKSRVFVTPALGPWVLVVGEGPWQVGFDDAHFRGIFDLDVGNSFEVAAALLTTWSATLATTVLGFYTHRIPEAHAWIACREGTFQRLCWYVGQEGEGGERGDRTEVERSAELGRSIDDSLREPGGDQDDWDPIDEGDVMAVAAAWSLDPTRVEDDHPQPGRGWIGQLPRQAGSARSTPSAGS